MATTGPRIGTVGHLVRETDGGGEFVLLQYIGSGGEGEVWKAELRTRNGHQGRLRALKIFDGDQYNGGNTDPDAVIRRWKDRYNESLRQLGDIDGVPGLTRTTQAFVAARPHLEGEKPEKGQVLYLEAPWVEGQNLGAWVESAHDRRERALDVVDRLCAIIDALAAAGGSHRDLAPGNIMIRPDGTLTLIDLTFVEHIDRPRFTGLNHFVWIPLDANLPGASGQASDRFSVGVITGYLLTGVTPQLRDVHGSTIANLEAAGYGEAGALVATLLDPDPLGRMLTGPLAGWSRRLRTLVEGAAKSVVTVDAVASRAGVAEVVAADRSGVWRTSLGANEMWRLRRSCEIEGAVRVAVAVDGVGEAVTYCLTRGGDMVMIRGPETVLVLDDANPSGGLASVALGDGSLLTVASSRVRELILITTPLEDDPYVRRESSVARTVLGLTTRLGQPLLLTTGDDGATNVGSLSPAGAVWDRAAPIAADVGDIAVGGYGDPETVLARLEGPDLRHVEQVSGEWVESPIPPSPIELSDVALVGRRGTTLVAVVGQGGCHVVRRDLSTWGDWTMISTSPSRAVKFVTTSSHRLQLVLLGADGVIHVFEEDLSDGWLPQGVVATV